MLKRKFRLVLFVLLLSMFFLVCCKNDMEDENQPMQNSNISTEKYHDNKEPENELVDGNDSEWDMSVLRSSLKLKEEMGIVFQHYDDFDNDKNEELIIDFGHDNTSEKDYIQNIYYIEKIEGGYEILSHIQSDGYGIFSVELINLTDMERPVLYCRNTNYANLIGFELYEIKDNSLKQLVYSASATGVGYDEMLGEDDVYYGFVQNRSSYDTLYTDLIKSYEFINGKFELTDVSADFYNYPDTPEDVVLEYLNMHSIKKTENIEIPDIEVRLRELCPREFEPPILYDYDVMVDYNILREGTLELNTKIHGKTNIAEVSVKYNGDIDKSEIVYSLGKSDDKWIIYDYNVLYEDSTELSRRINEYFDSLYLNAGDDIILDKYKKILLSQVSFAFQFVVADGEKSYFLNSIAYDGYWMKPIRFSLIDMNHDLIPELIVEGSLGAADFVLVIREVEEKMIAHEFSHRQMYDLKKDGSFGASGGAAHIGYFKLEFDNSKYNIHRIAETDTGEDTDGNLIPIFYIGETLVDENEFWEFWESLRNKEEAEWIYFELNNDMEN